MIVLNNNNNIVRTLVPSLDICVYIRISYYNHEQKKRKITVSLFSSSNLSDCIYWK